MVLISPDRSELEVLGIYQKNSDAILVAVFLSIMVLLCSLLMLVLVVKLKWPRKYLIIAGTYMIIGSFQLIYWIRYYDG